MQIVQTRSLESLDAYEIVEAPIPEPGAGLVRVKVAACGVGYVDALVALGRYQVRPPVPYIPGQEVAGVIDAVGAGVETFRTGERVMAAAQAGFAEFVLAPAESVSRAPAGVSLEQAAGFRLNYLTAIHGLTDRARLASGEQVLVFGAAGGVGVAAVQVAKALGARVIAAASSPEKRAFALTQGADAAIDTEVEGWRDRLKAAGGGRGPDVVFDPVCGPLFEPAFRSLAWNGRHLVVGFVGGPIPALKSNLTLMKGAALVGVDVRQFQIFEALRVGEHMATLLDWLGAGRLAPPVGRVFDFADYRAALEHAAGGTGLGKTVLRVG